MSLCTEWWLQQPPCHVSVDVQSNNVLRLSTFMGVWKVDVFLTTAVPESLTSIYCTLKFKHQNFFLSAPDQQDAWWFVLVHSSVCSETSERNILKMNELIFMQISTIGPWKSMKRSTLLIRRSKCGKKPKRVTKIPLARYLKNYRLNFNETWHRSNEAGDRCDEW